MTTVSIVGGGPAGSYTAYVIKRNNPDIDVAIHDARRQIGNPVNCAGGIVSFWLDRLGVRLPDSVVRGKIRGLRIVGPNGQSFEHHQDDIGEEREIGFVMDRQGFDQWLLDRAEQAGAEVNLGSNPAHWDPAYTFEGSDYIMGCDGWKSGLGTHLGLKTEVSDVDMHVGWEYRVRVPEYDQDYITFYVADEWAPEGYVWAFPEGGDVVKLGLGIPRSYKREGHDRRVDVRGYLERFLEDFPELNGVRVERKASGAGMIPTSKPMAEFVTIRDDQWYGLVGDAARMVDPLHGGGISTAMLAARVAGHVIAEEKPLSAYQRQWDKVWRPEHLRRYAMKEALTYWGNIELVKLVRALQDFHFRTSDAPAETGRMILHVLKKEPKMFGQMAARTLAGYAGVQW